MSEDAVKSHVFVSYSRRDAAFAGSLVTALQARGFHAYLDQKDILPGEPWKERLGGLIAAADTVVFLLSPDSIKSEICAWEVDEAERLAKRILPAECRPVATAEVPGRLVRLHWIRFSDAGAFDTALASLEQALLTDIAWLRELTRLMGIAEHWENGGRDATQLMNQADIKATEQLLATRPQNVALPPQLLSDFLETSRARLEEDTRKLRRITGRAFVKPALQALDAGKSTDALQLAAAGALLADDLGAEVVPELWSPMLCAIFDSRTLVVLEGSSASFSPDGRRIVITAKDGTAHVRETESGAEVACLKGHTNWVRSASFSLDGRRIVTASSDKTARVWDAESGTQITCLRGHMHGVCNASFSPDGGRIVTWSEDKTAKLWDAESGIEIAGLDAHTDEVSDASFSPDGQRVVTSSRDKTARVWDAENGKQIACLNAHTKWVNSASFSPDGRQIVTASDDGTARVWDAESGAEIASLAPPLHLGRMSVHSASFSPDGGRIVVASGSIIGQCGEARVWDAQSGEEIAHLNGHTNEVRDASFSPDGQRVVTAAHDGTARVWDVESGVEIACLHTSHTEPAGWFDVVFSASFSPDGRRIITASGDKKVRLWDAKNSAEIARLKGYFNSVVNASFSPDGSQIVTCSTCDDNDVRIWDAKSGKRIASLTHNSEEVWDATFSPDGRRLVTTSDDGTARVWDAVPRDNLDEKSGDQDENMRVAE